MLIKVKKTVSIILSMLIVVSVFIVMPVFSNAAGGVETKINTIRKTYSDGTYFTSDGKVCNSNKSDRCKLSNIPSRGGLPTGAKVASVTGDAWSCCSFARYVFYNVFGSKPESSISVASSNLKIGDYLHIKSGSYSHYTIFLGQDSNNWYVYNSNGTTTPTNIVKYNQAFQKSKWSFDFAYHAKNYDEINGSTPHTHSYTTFVEYQSSHPHYAVYKCSCGATQVNKNKTQYSTSCSTCINSLGAAQTISDGEYLIALNANQNYCLAVDGDKKDPSTNVHIWNSVRDDNYKSVVKVKHEGNGFYSLIFKNSGKALDVKNYGKANGTNVLQYYPTSNSNQRWVIKPTGDNKSFYIVSKCDGLYLDVYNGTAANGTNVQMYKGNGSAAQKWRFIASGLSTGQTIKDGKYKIVSAVGENLALDVKGGAGENQAVMQVYNRPLSDMSEFNVKYHGNGYYHIEYTKTNRRLDVVNNYAYKGVPIQLYDQNTYSAQQWIIKNAGDGYYYLMSKGTGMYLDNANAKNTDGNLVQGWLGNNAIAQKWKFIDSSVTIEPTEETTVNEEPTTSPIETIPTTEMATTEPIESTSSNIEDLSEPTEGEVIIIPEEEPTTESVESTTVKEQATTEPSEGTTSKVDVTTEPTENIIPSESVIKEPIESTSTVTPSEPTTVSVVPTNSNNDLLPQNVELYYSLVYNGDAVELHVNASADNAESYSLEINNNGVNTVILGASNKFTHFINDYDIGDIVFYIVAKNEYGETKSSEYVIWETELEHYFIQPTQSTASTIRFNPVKVSVKTKSIKLKKVKSKKQTVKPLTIKNAKGTIKVTKVKNGTTAKIYKKIKVKSKTGAVTFKKGKYAKKTYKIRMKITVSGNLNYKSKTLYKTVKVKIK